LAITAPLSPTTVIGYEEPENGVHAQRLKLIADLLENATLSGKQIIVNTHSSRLPGYFGNKLLLICRKEERATTFTPSPPLFQEQEVGQALDEEGEQEPTPLMERIVRGDFGG